MTPETPFPAVREIDLPQTNDTLKNFATLTCGGTVAESFRQSCNTTFGAIGLQLGDGFVPGMEAFGIGSSPPLDVSPGAAASGGPPEGSFRENQPLFAFAGIGQGDVFTTPLQLALVGAAIANDGTIMKPHVMAAITDADGGTVRTHEDRSWRTATDAGTAETVTGMMVSVVQAGTGRAAQIPGVTVAGKTGTAQTPNGNPHTWFVGFAPAEDPQVVVAVLVEHGGSAGGDGTGGRVAAPLARQMLELLLS